MEYKNLFRFFVKALLQARGNIVHKNHFVYKLEYQITRYEKNNFIKPFPSEIV